MQTLGASALSNITYVQYYCCKLLTWVMDPSHVSACSLASHAVSQRVPKECSWHMMPYSQLVHYYILVVWLARGYCLPFAVLYNITISQLCSAAWAVSAIACWAPSCWVLYDLMSVNSIHFSPSSRDAKGKPSLVLHLRNLNHAITSTTKVQVGRPQFGTSCRC